MPPRRKAADTALAEPANPGPVEPPRSPEIEATDLPISMDHPVPVDDTEEYHLPSDTKLGLDAPGPSSTFIPPPLSPPLPSLRDRPFPPEDSDPEDEWDEKEEILATLPIYLSPSLFPNLHLFQFPLSHKTLNPPGWARDRGKVITSRVKESAGRVEVEIPVDGGNDVWRDDRAREIGFVTDVNAVNGHEEDVVGGYGFGGREGAKEKGKGKKSKKDKDKWGDKTRYRSDLVPNATGYYSGVIHDGALHLHPITKVMQFRPSLAYLDDLDTANRERASRKRDEDEDAPKPRPAQNQPPPGRPLRKLHEDEENDGSGSIKDFRTKMWNTAAVEDGDTWVPYAWRVGNDERVTKSLEALYVSPDKREKLECKTQPLDYLNR